MRAAPQSDEVLVWQMLGGDSERRKQAWQEWYAQDGPELAAFVRSRCSERYEDIVHETFFIAFQNVSTGKYEDQGKPLIAYLKGIARRLIWQEFGNEIYPLHSSREQANGCLIPDEEEDWDLQINHCHLWPKLSELIQLLTPRQQAIVNLRLIQERPVKEVAEALGMSQSNVKVTTHRLKKRLKDLFAIYPTHQTAY